MPKLTIRVGAAVDQSLKTAFQPMIDAAKKAQTAINAEAKKSARGVATETKRGTDAAEEAFRQLEHEIMTGMAHAGSSATSSIKKFASESKTSFDAMKRNFGEAAREAEASMRRIGHSQKNASFGFGSVAWSGAKAGGAWLGQGVVDLARMGIGSAVGMAAMLGHAAGVRDPSQLMADNADLEKNAVLLSNSGYMPGQRGANGKRQDPKELLEDIRKTSIASGLSSVDTMAGVRAFVGRTGDLQTARDLMPDIGKLSQATGAKSEDLYGAAADISRQLGNDPNKAKKTYELLRVLSAQGKLGGEEMSTAAAQMPKIGAAAGAYGGSRDRAVADLGALMQMSRARGGSGNAAQAATSTVAFTNLFDKGARERAFKKFGVDTRDAKGMLRDPETVITNALRAASSEQHGGMASFATNMGQMFSDVRARSATRGFENIFKENGGGEAGIEAVKQAFEELANATMSETEVMDSFNAAMKTSKSQAEQFNEEWGKQIAELQGNLLPALQLMGPAIVDATKKIVEVTKIFRKEGQDDDGRSADIKALDARAVLSRDLREGTADPDHVKAAEKAAAALDEQIKQKAGNITSAPNWTDKVISRVNPFYGKELLDAKQTRHEQDEKQYTSMIHERDNLKEMIRALTDRLPAKHDKVQVEIVSDKTNRGGGSPPRPHKGRTPGSDHK